MAACLGNCAMGKETMNGIICGAVAVGSGGRPACGLVRALFGGGGVTDRDRDVDGARTRGATRSSSNEFGRTQESPRTMNT